jgi:hypothetical protein
MTPTRRVAIGLLVVASRVLPEERREWARDMRTEVDHIGSDALALRWAFGCVVASVNQRMAAMLKLNGPISRPVLVLEWFMCFVPLTLLWLAAVRYIVSFGPTADIVVATAFGTFGPIALVVALFKTLSTSQRSLGLLSKCVVAVFALMAVLQLANAGAAGRLNLSWFKFEFGTFVMVSLLPLLGSLHLAYFARTQRGLNI